MLGRLAGELARAPVRGGVQKAVRREVMRTKISGRSRACVQGRRVVREVKKNYASGPASLRQLSETFLTSTNAEYVEEMWEAWKKDPTSVHVSWAAFFKNLEAGAPLGEGWVIPPTLATAPHFMAPPTQQAVQQQVQNLAGGDKLLEDHLKVQLLIRAYQFRGHELASLDPLGMSNPEKPAELSLSMYGFTEADLDREFFTYASGLHAGLLAGKPRRTLREIISILDRAYCKSLGVEFMHMRSRERANWIRKKLELDVTPEPSREDRLIILDRLLWATKFEQFLKSKWNTTKRFGLEGSESLIPGLKALIDRSSDLGVENVVVGMAHRGRLNVLGNVLRKPLAQIFHEFEHGVGVNQHEYEEWGASGDVKYHLGTSCNRPTHGGKSIHISVLSNPSHLEAVNPVVEGKARCKQYYKGDKTGEKVMTIQIHGDAAFPGQGVVYETINMSGLPDYTTGGTVHVVTNNQVGFTTDPRFSRSGIYCTDPVKMSGAPIFHVNGDDPEAVVRAMMLAAEYRAEFKSDVCVDVVAYRLNGHNEIDEPSITQPLMYKKIRNEMKPCLDLYKADLLAKGVITEQDYTKLDQSCQEKLEAGFEAGKTYIHRPSDWLESRWKDFKGPAQLARIKPTGVKVETLKHIGETLTRIPEGFEVHSVVKKVLHAKQQMFETGKDLDWATAEGLAFGSLLLEGNHVRIAGQDVQRGTFSQRHLVWTDQKTGERYVPLNHLPGAKEKISAVNSNLSEYACMGFELGYSLETPNALVCWEGQFGDFANGAQIIIDQFLSCGEQKWFRQTGLTLLLPHGYEGQGPEHSSARLERFLQLSDSDPDVVIRDREDLIQRSNWAVVNCSTPANYFHVLRQQIHREYRKPLVIMTPKSLLRHPLCKSDLSALDNQGDDQGFQLVIGETAQDLVPDAQIRRVIFCSGKVYYDLLKERTNKKINDVAIVRVEQLAPFPFEAAMTELAKYPKATVIWAQEEHKNMGAWTYMHFALSTAIREVRGTHAVPKYVGRNVAASPATGSTYLHEQQTAKLLRDAFAQDL